VIGIPGRVLETDDDKVKSRLTGHLQNDSRMGRLETTDVGANGYVNPTGTEGYQGQVSITFEQSDLDNTDDIRPRTFTTVSGKLESEL